MTPMGRLLIILILVSIVFLVIANFFRKSKKIRLARFSLYAFLIVRLAMVGFISIFITRIIIFLAIGK